MRFITVVGPCRLLAHSPAAVG